MNVYCPSVCTTTTELVLNVYVLMAALLLVLAIVLFFMKKIKAWHMLIVICLSLIIAFLVGVKVNTCDSGCKQNGSIEFENELFGEPSNDKTN